MIGIVLSRHDVREYDQIINVYTKERGKQSYLAKGVKKIISKNSAFLEPFSLLELEIIRGQELDRLIKVHPIFISKSIRSDLSKLVHVQKVGKVLEELLREGECDEALFNFLNSWMLHVDAAPSVGEVVWYSFLIKLFNILGFRPMFDRCGLNDNHQISGNIFFVVSLGGVICKECAASQLAPKAMFIQLNEEDIVVVKKIVDPNWLSEDVRISDSIKQTIIQFGEYHLGKKIGV